MQTLFKVFNLQSRDVISIIRIYTKPSGGGLRLISFEWFKIESSERVDCTLSD
tara:strand:- start:33549 stop:33707 length:159 start_codon:yes stop_codon:yes gene_type:complete